jgi:ubiquinone/menaquinone biosynthesis C-methylase UbiE
MDTNDYIDANRRHWDEVVPLHAASAFYDVPSFKAGASTLKHVEREEVGDVRGKTLLHVQCHFGMDTLSWAREGAVVTGVDFAPQALETAASLADEIGMAARWVQSSVYDLPDVLDEQFDIVFTSYGALSWLPDIPRWGRTLAQFVKPGGFLYVAEFHPAAYIFDDTEGLDDLRVKYLYFPSSEPFKEDGEATYAAAAPGLVHRDTYSWPYTIGDVVTSLADARLRIEYLHEFPFSTYQFLPITHEMPDGSVRLKQHDGSVPLLFSVKATTP